MMARQVGPQAGRWKLVHLVGVGVALVLLTAVGPLVHHRFGGMAHWLVVALMAAGAASATLASDRLPQRQALIVIAIAGAAMRILQLGTEPYLSDDLFRYIWDGRVQAAGINPYRFVPAASELQQLRDVAIYPNINRANYAPTIYPPVAQMFFFVVTRLGESVFVMKLALVVCEFGAMAAMLGVLGMLGLRPTRIAALAWHPLPIWEIAGNGHIDALMIALLMAALLLAIGGRVAASGVVTTMAALVKPPALLLLPVLWRPWRLGLPVLVVATAGVLYLPYLSVGWKVLGFIPGYVAEEGFAKGHGFHYLSMVQHVLGVPPQGGSIYAALCGLLMLALALAVSFRGDDRPVARVAALAVLLTVFLTVLTPHYSWYYLVLVPFLTVYPGSWTLWLLTVGCLQIYHVIPGDPLPSYFVRQYTFHLLVFAALVRDGFVVFRCRERMPFQTIVNRVSLRPADLDPTRTQGS